MSDRIITRLKASGLPAEPGEDEFLFRQEMFNTYARNVLVKTRRQLLRDRLYFWWYHKVHDRLFPDCGGYW